jgi:ABC-type glycerol-3-phosphate transport system permease component
MALILSHMLIALPVIVWIMSSYFDSIPLEMEESAMLDGASRQQAFLLIILPLSSPGIVTATTLSFIFSWNNFMFSQVLSMEKTRTLPIASITLSPMPKLIGAASWPSCSRHHHAGHHFTMIFFKNMWCADSQ